MFPRARVSRAAGRPIDVPDQILVKLRDLSALNEILQLHKSIGGSIKTAIPHAQIQIVRLASTASMAAALALYRSSRLVEYAEQDAYAYLSATPNDQFYPLQWHYPQINLPAAWDVATGASVIVAILDSGIRPHADLSGITVQGFDFVDNDADPTDPGCASNSSDFSHGMHVSGTIAAVTNNGAGVAGVNWGGAAATKIMPLRVGGEVGGNCGAVLRSAVIAALHYAADHGAKVANMSFGGRRGSTALSDAIDYAHGRGVTLVAAAGNDNDAVDFPAAYSNVMAVAATDCNSEKASYSDHGPEIDVAAPGGDLVDCTRDGFDEFVLSTSWSPDRGNGYFFAAGTSMAAPHVAGLAALLVARGLTTPADIRARLQSTATDRGSPGFDPLYGWGQVNAGAALGVSRPPAILRAFSGVRAAQTITVQSNSVEVSSTGSFLITNAQTGTKSVFVWQDRNANSIVDAGDVFGQTDGVMIQPGSMTSGVNVIAQPYLGPPIGVVGP